MIVDPPRESHIRWHQDARQRVVEISGDIDERFPEHLNNGTIDLGRRALVIDLTDVALTEAAMGSLSTLKERLAGRTLTVLVKRDFMDVALAHEIEVVASEEEPS